MKPPVNKIAYIAIFFSLLSTLQLPASASANDSAWSLDSSASIARFFSGSVEKPDSVNVGVARVTGTVSLDTNHPTNSIVELSIYPAGEDWGRSLSPVGDLPPGYVPDVTDHTLLTFKSTRTLKAEDGTLQVSGNLTLTRVERSISADANEAYSGPIYGAPVIRTITKEATFVFPSPNAAVASGPSPSTRATNVLSVTGFSRISREDFKELSTAISETSWPPVLANERCEMPSTIGEDYSGANCTATEVAVTSAANCQEPASAGEDYSGPLCTPPSKDVTTIALELELTTTSAEASATLSGNSSTR